MCPVYAMPTRPSPRSERLGTPNTPAIRFMRVPFFGDSLVRHCYGLSGCSPPWTDLTEFPRPPGAFTSRLPAGLSPFPPLDMTTTATGLLCWRDFHPQERQLASLHQTRTCRFPASGSSGESFAPGDVAMDDPGFVDYSSNDAVRDSPVEEAPQMAMVSATPVLSSPDWLSVVGSWTGLQGSGSPPVCRGNGSLLLAPPFPRTGPDELGSPPSPVL